MSANFLLHRDLKVKVNSNLKESKTLLGAKLFENKSVLLSVNPSQGVFLSIWSYYFPDTMLDEDV